jgi:hypothetical protein
MLPVAVPASVGVSTPQEAATDLIGYACWRRKAELTSLETKPRRFGRKKTGVDHCALLKEKGNKCPQFVVPLRIAHGSQSFRDTSGAIEAGDGFAQQRRGGANLDVALCRTDDEQTSIEDGGASDDRADP